MPTSITSDNDQLWEPETIRVNLLWHLVILSNHLPTRLGNAQVLASVEDVLKLPTVLSLEETRKLLESIRLPCH